MAHRDLKPENLLLKENTESIHVKIADFGFAKVDRGDLITPQFTPYYASPQVDDYNLVHHTYCTSRKNSLKLIELCSINKVSLV